jgi:hypothetical protein
MTSITAQTHATLGTDERYFTGALGRHPQTEVTKVVDILERIWSSTLYGTPVAPVP